MSGTLSPVGQLVAVIQAQLAPRAATASSKTARGKRSDTYRQEGLAGLIELRVRQIAPDEPQRGRKAFRVFLEAVLLAHFGEELLNDPKFFQMVGDIQSAMEADEGCRKLVDRAIAHLQPE